MGQRKCTQMLNDDTFKVKPKKPGGVSQAKERWGENSSRSRNSISKSLDVRDFLKEPKQIQCVWGISDGQETGCEQLQKGC